jgi:DNA-binding transcriptional LysR family regulator
VGRQDRIHFVTDMGMLCRLVADGTGIGVLAERIAPDYIV